MGSHRDREVVCSASDSQGSNFEFCVWRKVSSQHIQEVFLAQFSLHVYQGGLKPHSFSFGPTFTQYFANLLYFLGLLWSGVKSEVIRNVNNFNTWWTITSKWVLRGFVSSNLSGRLLYQYEHKSIFPLRSRRTVTCRGNICINPMLAFIVLK